MQNTHLAEFIKIQSFLKKNIYRLPLPAVDCGEDSEKIQIVSTLKRKPHSEPC